MLRPGNAGSNTATDHLTVLEQALAQLRDRWRDKPILVRADGAGYSHALLRALSTQGLEFSVGYPVTEAVRDAIRLVPKWAWNSANNADGDLREHADVIDITDLLDLSAWSTSCPACGSSSAASSHTPARRWTPSRSATASATKPSPPTPPAGRSVPRGPHRAHARVEDRIRTGRHTRLGQLPSRHEKINAVWLELALIAADLLTLSQSMLLTDKPDLHRAEPDAGGDVQQPVAQRLVTRGQRKVFLRLAEHWPGPSPWPERFRNRGSSRSRPDRPAPPATDTHEDHGDTGQGAGEAACPHTGQDHHAQTITLSESS